MPLLQMAIARSAPRVFFLDGLLLGVCLCVCQRPSQLELGVSALAAEDERGQFPIGASLDGVLACVRRPSEQLRTPSQGHCPSSP